MIDWNQVQNLAEELAYLARSETESAQFRAPESANLRVPNAAEIINLLVETLGLVKNNTKKPPKRELD